MARNDPQINIRLPAALKQWIETTAAANNRSMNAEIVSRLYILFNEEERWMNGADGASEFGEQPALRAEEVILLSKYSGVINIVADLVAKEVARRIGGEEPAGVKQKPATSE